MAVSVFFSVAMLVATCYAKEYNCTVDQSLCTGSGLQSIVVGGLKMCCPPQATFSLNNNDCTCIEATPIEEPCLEGVPLCRQASSVTCNNGVCRCCMPGYQLNSVNGATVNGVMMDVCTCTPMGGGGGGNFMSTVMGFPRQGGSSMFMSGGGGGQAPTAAAGQQPQGPAFVGNANATAASADMAAEMRKMGDAWRNWAQNTGRGFRTWSRDFSHSMRGTGLDLARNLNGVLQQTLTNTMVPVQRAFNSMIGNAFRAIPRF